MKMQLSASLDKVSASGESNRQQSGPFFSNPYSFLCALRGSKNGIEFDDAGCLLISEVELVFSQPDALGGGSMGDGSGKEDGATA